MATARRPRVDGRLLGRAPIEDGHQLMLGGAPLGAHRRPYLAKTMGGAFREAGFVATIAEPVAKALGGEWLPEIGLQERFRATWTSRDDVREYG
jgi:hypothetical protein